jgi:hypothetical protein
MRNPSNGTNGGFLRLLGTPFQLVTEVRLFPHAPCDLAAGAGARWGGRVAPRALQSTPVVIARSKRASLFELVADLVRPSSGQGGALASEPGLLNAKGDQSSTANTQHALEVPVRPLLTVLSAT